MFWTLLYEYVQHLLWGGLLSALGLVVFLGAYYSVRTHRVRRASGV